ncbi:hypothetical protein [Hyphomicrobium sulfonivorans]|uniref:hypothetical protein n=1 Tax=Hyphomicrobium sulfonivorans TaxID=121290 RepID=UPI000A63B761|nr:hypothetical protein [Hyphomicrobium sulfonivorans]
MVVRTGASRAIFSGLQFGFSRWLLVAGGVSTCADRLSHRINVSVLAFDEIGSASSMRAIGLAAQHGQDRSVSKISFADLACYSIDILLTIILWF